MLFKIGLTVVIVVSVYLFYALRYTAYHSGTHEQELHDKPEEHAIDEGGLLDKKDSQNVKVGELPENKNAEDVGDHPQKQMNSPSKDNEGINIVAVACGDRLKDVVVMMKSAVLLTESALTFHLFMEEELQTMFKRRFIMEFPEKLQNRIQLGIYDIQYPEGENALEWKKLFKPCASQRLFIPSILVNVDAVLYVDTDMLFLEPVDHIWTFFKKFNSSQLAALAPESEDHATGWYNRFARHPYYGPLGVNSGVMLMNLTRIRNSHWMPSIIKYYKEYRLKTTWGDQDLINIFFHFYPQMLYVYPCQWNFRSDHCMYMSTCKGAETEGAHILHGSRQIWHNDKQPAFKAVFKTFEQHDFSESLNTLLKNLKHKLSETSHTNCGKLTNIFTKKLESIVENQLQNGNRYNI